MRIIIAAALILIALCSYDEGGRPASFIIVKDSTAKQKPVNINTTKRVLDIPDNFWLELVHRYPTASMLFLSPVRPNWPLANVSLTDTSYSYIDLPIGLLINYLPENLSREAHLNFWEGAGFFVVNDSTAASNDTASGLPAWTKPSASFERIYPRFYSLLDDWETNRLLIIKNDLKRKMYAELVREGD